MEDENKSLIIAERVKLNFAGELTVFIIFAVIMAALMGVGIYFEVTLLIVFCSVLLVAIIVFGTIDIIRICKNNCLPSIIMTYKDDVFTLCDEEEPLRISKNDIIDMTYKNNKSFIYSTYYVASHEWNYGTLTLFLKDKEGTKNLQKLTLKNISYPDKVYDKISHILGWDLTDK